MAQAELGSGRMPLGVVAAYASDVLAGVAGDPHDLALPAPLHQHGVPDGVGQLLAAPVQRRLGSAVGAGGCGDGVGTHGWRIWPACWGVRSSLTLGPVIRCAALREMRGVALGNRRRNNARKSWKISRRRARQVITGNPGEGRMKAARKGVGSTSPGLRPYSAHPERNPVDMMARMAVPVTLRGGV